MLDISCQGIVKELHTLPETTEFLLSMVIYGGSRNIYCVLIWTIFTTLFSYSVRFRSSYIIVSIRAAVTVAMVSAISVILHEVLLTSDWVMIITNKRVLLHSA